MLVLSSWVIALILQLLLQTAQEKQFSVEPNIEAPGILLIQPSINPMGQIVLQNGL